MREIAPAKLNLCLQLVGKRADGYHLLDSIVAFADYGDELTFTPQSDPGISLTVDGPFAADIPLESNLVIRAAALIQRRAGIQAGISIHLQKNLPVGAGLGGGSADAAAVLRALNRLWKAGFSVAELADMALPLGADVPACVEGRPLRMQGIGEDVTLLPELTEMPMILIWPGSPLFTADVFRHTKPPYSGALATPDGWMEACNDLTPAAIGLLPQLGEIIANLKEQEGCVLGRMSGSGSACFALFKNEGQRDAALASVSARFPSAWVKACRLQSAA